MEDSGTDYHDQSIFLDAIYGDFVDNVVPEQGLLDEFFAIGAINSEEEQTVEAEPTRRGKARKLWFALQRVPPRLLGEKCVPILERMYPHVILRKQFDWKEQCKSESMCFRHAIEKRMTVRRFADILPESHCSTAAEYENVIGAQSPVAWKKLFNIIKQNCHNEKLKQSLIKMLHSHHMQLPQNFDLLLARGFPCTCDKGHRKESFPSRKVLVPRLEDGTSSETSYPSSSMSDPDIDMSSVSSEGADNSTFQPLADTEKSKTLELFENQDHKDEYHSYLDKINKAIKYASFIKPVYRELECIHSGIISYAFRAKNEPARESQKKNIIRLRTKATSSYGKMKRIYAAVKRTWKSVSDDKNSFSFCVPPYRNKEVLNRKQILHNEKQEAFHFFESSRKIVKEIIFYGNQQI